MLSKLRLIVFGRGCSSLWSSEEAPITVRVTKLNRGASIMNRVGIVCITCAGIIPTIGLAEVTGSSGGGLPVSTFQPSLGITYAIRTAGLFPGRSGPVGTVGEISMFAGNFAPGSYMPADGRLLPIAEYDTLFTLLGTTYGGDGQTNFALPDLRGRTAIGSGSGAGLTSRLTGEMIGRENVTLTTSNLPAHSHTVPIIPSTTSTSTGGGVSYDKMQPSLAINYIVPVQGDFPFIGGTHSATTGFDPVLGFVYATASDYRPDGWAPASGQVLPIAQNQALFSILGTTYGGNGQTTFQLPNLRGRAPVGAGDAHALGSVFGTEAISLTTGQMPAHSHLITSTGGSTDITGSNATIANEQPSLALNYLIATSATFPSREGEDGTIEEALLGQISLFAGNFAPDGWQFASGQVLQIAGNTALFSILGTTYGGDGSTTFALPNLNGALAVGAGTGIGLSPFLLGQVSGDATLTLDTSELAPHAHEVVVPEPAALGLVAVCVAGLTSRRRREHA